MKKLFIEALETNIRKGNKAAIDFGIRILKEIRALDIPTAVTYERIERTTQKIMGYIEQYGTA